MPPIDYDPYASGVDPEVVSQWLQAVKDYFGSALNPVDNNQGFARQTRDIFATPAWDFSKSTRENLLNPEARAKAMDMALALGAGPIKNALGPAEAAVNALQTGEPAVQNILMSPQEQLAAKLSQIEEKQAPLPMESGSFFQRKAQEMAPPSIKAYHGSPYDFDAFDLSKIGTGEGAQAYGHGLYFAENEPVARNYRDQLAPKANMRDPIGNAYDLLHNYGASKEQLISQFEDLASKAHDPIQGQFYKDSAEAIKSGAVDKYTPPGRMYEVNLHADPDTFLHWDKPLSEQSQQVKNALNTIEDFKSLQKTLGPNSNKMTGGDILQTWGDQEGTSKALRNAGISGIKYADAGSRNKPDFNYYIETPGVEGRINRSTAFTDADKAQTALDLALKHGYDAKLVSEPVPTTHNYVVFDPSIIDIVKKYGLAPLIAGGAMTLNDTPGQAQHLIPVDHNPFEPIEPEGGSYMPPQQPLPPQGARLPFPYPVSPPPSYGDYIEPPPRQ